MPSTSTKVLERRNDNWRTLHDYILSEREQAKITGPGGLLLDGMDREFQWSIRDGYLVRSPVKANGVPVGAGERHRDAAGQEVVAGVAGADFDLVAFAAETVDGFDEENIAVGHGTGGLKNFGTVTREWPDQNGTSSSRFSAAGGLAAPLRGGGA